MEMHEKSIKYISMHDEIKRFLNDDSIINRIGNKTFKEIEIEIYEVCLVFNIDKREYTPFDTIWGHRISFIKYYCDTFNKGELDDKHKTA